MKKIVALIGFILVTTISHSQPKKPDQTKVQPEKWKYSIEQSSGVATLVFKLKLEKGWHVYSQNTPEGGPLPMVFKFEQSNCYELTGKVEEPKPHEEFDSTFEVKVQIFDGEVTFRQKVKVKNTDCRISGTIEYQICKEACIFKDTGFAFDLSEGNKK